MFNIIIAIIAIALVVIISYATMYYGGDSFNDGKLKAEAARLVNEGSQIASAAMVYRAKGGDLSASDFTLNTLVDAEYLKTVPVNWNPDTDFVIYPVNSNDDPKAETLCYVANSQAGFHFDGAEVAGVVPYSKDTTKGIPLCSLENINPLVACCISNQD